MPPSRYEQGRFLSSSSGDVGVLPAWFAVLIGSERRLSRGEDWDLVLVGGWCGDNVG